jgi:hypothetical protein
MTALGPLYLHHRDPRSLQVTSQTSSVAARTFHTGTPHGTEALRPVEEFVVSLHSRGHIELSETSAQPIEGNRHMHLQVGVDPQDHFTRSSRALAGNDGHASILPLDVVALSIWPDDAERTDAAVRGQLRASSYKVTTLRSLTGSCRTAPETGRRIGFKAPVVQVQLIYGSDRSEDAVRNHM